MGTRISVMNKLTSILLWIGVFFLVESVCSRTFYVINDQYPNTYESQDPQMQDTEFKRFNNDLISIDEARPNPFYDQDQQNNVEDAPFHFRRSLRDNHNDRAAEDYYNEWIMSNIGK